MSETPNFKPGELNRVVEHLAGYRLVPVVKALRADVSHEDVVLLLETLSAIVLPGDDGGHQLRRRYLTLPLHALRAPGTAPLPGRPAELTARWRRGP